MELLDKALKFAIDAHSGQKRKNSVTPYIVHPLEVVAIAATMTSDENTLCAAVLHDVIEDTPVTKEDLYREFGERITFLVMAETEEKEREISASESWLHRKQNALAKLASIDDIETKILILSDKLSNVRSFYREYIAEGDALWNHFNMKDKDKQFWYYHEVYKMVGELKDFVAYKEYERLLTLLFGKEL